MLGPGRIQIVVDDLSLTNLALYSVLVVSLLDLQSADGVRKSQVV